MVHSKASRKSSMTSINVSPIAVRSPLSARCEIFLRKIKKKPILASAGTPQRAPSSSSISKMILSWIPCSMNGFSLWWMRSTRSKRNNRSWRMSRPKSRRNKGRRLSSRSLKRKRLLKKRKKHSRNKLNCKLQMLPLLTRLKLLKPI